MKDVFAEALEPQIPREVAEEFLRSTLMPEYVDMDKEASAGLVAGSLIGAVKGGAKGYSENKRGTSGKSKAEAAQERALLNHLEQQYQKGKPPSNVSQLKERFLRSKLRWARTMADHLVPSTIAQAAMQSAVYGGLGEYAQATFSGVGKELSKSASDVASLLRIPGDRLEKVAEAHNVSPDELVSMVIWGDALVEKSASVGLEPEDEQFLGEMAPVATQLGQAEAVTQQLAAKTGAPSMVEGSLGQALAQREEREAQDQGETAAREMMVATEVKQDATLDKARAILEEAQAKGGLPELEENR